MVQGSFKSGSKALKVKGKPRKGGKVTSQSNRKVNKAKFAAKKGSATQMPKQAKQRQAAKEEKKTTKMINSYNEQQMAARCFQNQEKLTLKDVSEKGRELARDIRRTQVKKKKTRVEEKLAKAKEKV
ncbi:unnamed protein product, partial [Discosporangium mesarthrocarpum]